MKIEITVNEENIVQTVEKLIAEEMVREYGTMAREAKYGVREGVDKAVKAYIYSQKEEIIEKCVKRATAELVRKGLPKLLEKNSCFILKGGAE